MSKSIEKKSKSLIFITFQLSVALIMTASLFYWSTASGAGFPTKKIQMILPSPPGGPTDTTARILSNRLFEVLGQRIIVVNKTGGGQAIGIQAALAEPADGHTMLVTTNSLLLLPLITKGIAFRLKDFTPINLASSAPICMFVRKDAPWGSLEELIADAKKNPGKFTYSSAGPASGARIAAELFQMATGTKITQIPMNGASIALTAVLGGQVNMSFLGFQLTSPHVEAGTLRYLAVLQDKRLSEYPNIPTFPEKGYPTVTCPNWVGFFVSAKTPAAIKNKLGQVFNDILKEKEIQEKIEKTGLTIDNMPPKEAAKYLAVEEDKLIKMAKIANIVPQ